MAGAGVGSHDEPPGHDTASGAPLRSGASPALLARGKASGALLRGKGLVELDQAEVVLHQEGRRRWCGGKVAGAGIMVGGCPDLPAQALQVDRTTAPSAQLRNSFHLPAKRYSLRSNGTSNILAGLARHASVRQVRYPDLSRFANQIWASAIQRRRYLSQHRAPNVGRNGNEKRRDCAGLGSHCGGSHGVWRDGRDCNETDR
jgi:hypothetical protein